MCQGVLDAASDATVPEQQSGLSGGIESDVAKPAQTAVAGAEHGLDGLDAAGIRGENGLVRRFGLVDVHAGPCELAIAEPGGDAPVQRAAIQDGIERSARDCLVRAVADFKADPGEEIRDRRIISEFVGIHDREVRAAREKRGELRQRVQEKRCAAENAKPIERTRFVPAFGLRPERGIIACRVKLGREHCGDGLNLCGASGCHNLENSGPAGVSFTAHPAALI